METSETSVNSFICAVHIVTEQEEHFNYCLRAVSSWDVAEQVEVLMGEDVGWVDEVWVSVLEDATDALSLKIQEDVKTMQEAIREELERERN